MTLNAIALNYVRLLSMLDEFRVEIGIDDRGRRVIAAVWNWCWADYAYMLPIDVDSVSNYVVLGLLLAGLVLEVRRDSAIDVMERCRKRDGLFKECELGE